MQRIILTIFLLFANQLTAETVEEILYMPTDASSGNLFLLNPANHKPGPTQVGVLGLQREKELNFNQDHTGDPTFEQESKYDHIALGTLMDLGAGAGFGIVHQMMYQKNQSKMRGNRFSEREELVREQSTAGKVVIELTENLSAGINLKYFHKSWDIYGHSFLSEENKTKYSVTMFGFGYGLNYRSSQWAASYAYFPPLRGKSDIQGEELIVVEPGKITADLQMKMTPEMRLGLGGGRALVDFDDRAQGTTAADNETTISLFGLDIDQYLLARSDFSLGVEYKVMPTLYVRGAIFQETSSFHFNEMQRILLLGVQQNNDEIEMKSMKYKVDLSYQHKQLKLSFGVEMLERKHEFSTDQNGAVYKSTVQTQFLSVDTQL